MPQTDGPITYGMIDTSEVAELAGAMGVPISLVTNRLAWSRCYVGRRADAIAGYGWVSKVDTRIGEIEATIRPAAGEAYVWHCVTLPAARRQGLYRGLLRFIVGDLARAGLERVWIATRRRNRPSCQGAQQAGFHPVLRIDYLRVRSRCWYRVHTARGARPETIDSGRRALRLRERSGIPARA